jgi:hypothetical protein
MNFVIAIPSYRRADTIQKATLHVLEKHKIDPSIVYIFVADKKEEKCYREALGKKWNIVVGEPGMKQARVFMSRYFQEGCRIFYMDDDVYEIWQCEWKEEKYRNNPVTRMSGNVLVPLKNLLGFIQLGFQECERKQRRLFGVNAVKNAYFCKAINDPMQCADTRDGLYFTVGTMYGCINCREACAVTAEVKADYECTLRYYLLDGGVLRFPWVTISTRFYSEKGGMQSDNQRSWDKSYHWTRWIADTYEGLAWTNDKRKRKDKESDCTYLELRLKDQRLEKTFGKLPEYDKAGTKRK